MPCFDDLADAKVPGLTDFMRCSGYRWTARGLLRAGRVERRHLWGIQWFQFWSQLSSFVAIRERSKDHIAGVNEDLRISMDLGLRIWKAGSLTAALTATRSST